MMEVDEGLDDRRPSLFRKQPRARTVRISLETTEGISVWESQKALELDGYCERQILEIWSTAVKDIQNTIFRREAL